MPHSRSASASGAYPPRSPSPTPRAPQYRAPSPMPFEDMYQTPHDPTMHSGIKHGHTRSKSGGHLPSQAFLPFAFPHGHMTPRIPSPDPGYHTPFELQRPQLVYESHILQRLERLLQLQWATYNQVEQGNAESKERDEELLRNQKLHSDQLDVCQKSIDALLTQNYELHEYTIPRFFVILPESELDTDGKPLYKTFKNMTLKNVLLERFRLYFLCECGEHPDKDMGVDLDPNSKLEWDEKNLRRVHLAHHDGYEIARPKKFFAQYGPYVLAVLKVLRLCLYTASTVGPLAVHLATGQEVMARLTEVVTKNPLDATTVAIEYLTSHLGSGALLETLGQGGNCSQDADDLSSSIKALEGADLRQLDTFLRKNDENNFLGNLSRISTSKGQVKWVCQKHKPFAEQTRLMGSFITEAEHYKGRYDAFLGKITLTLPSVALAHRFSKQLRNQTTINELDLTLTWNFTTLELQELVVAICLTNIRDLRLDLTDRNRPSGAKDRYYPLLSLYSSPKLRSLSLQGLRSFGRRTIDLSDDMEPSPLLSYHHRTGLGENDIPRIINILSKCPNLLDLRLGSELYSLVDDDLCEAIGSLKKLKVLYLWNFKHPTEPTVKGLLSGIVANTDHLKELVIINTVVDPGELHAVVRKFSRSLQVLILDPMHSYFHLDSILGTEPSHGALTTTPAPQLEPSPSSKWKRKSQPPAASTAVAPKVPPLSKLRELHLNTY
ncbi:hypothetical protein BGX29_001011, partial [Mortierella sp. GBA35]